MRLAMVQLPGVNTPQFDWIRAHTRGKPKPIGAVYQPEVAARAIWKAAHSSRKEWIVGAPAYQAIFGDKLMSPILDRYLARDGIEAQQDVKTSGRTARTICSNRFPETMARTDGSTSKARTRSPLLWFSEHRALLAGGAVVAAGAAAFLARRRPAKGERD